MGPAYTSLSEEASKSAEKRRDAIDRGSRQKSGVEQTDRKEKETRPTQGLIYIIAKTFNRSITADYVPTIQNTNSSIQCKANRPASLFS